MQSEKTLMDLKFYQTEEGGWYKKGIHQLFKADVEKNNSQIYIRLLLVRDEIDFRKHSTNYGKHYLSPIKDCCSDGSVEKALIKYDIAIDQINFSVGGINIKTV